MRHHKSAEEWRDKFLETLRGCGNIRESAAAAGVHRATAYRARDADAEFAEAWDDALDEAADVLEMEARRRAIDGVEEPVYFRGREVGKVRRYSDTLLMFLLKGIRPEKYRPSYNLAGIVAAARGNA
jgi:hypothetical protein